MNWDYKRLLPEDFSDQSRVWIYQAARLFTMSEALHIEDVLNDFVAKWNAHGEPVKGYANLLFGQFIVLMADETTTTVSGCSTDSSVRVIKQIEAATNVKMFDRLNLAFQVKDKIQMLPASQVEYALEHGFINSDTIYFNNTVLNKKDLEEKWMIPLKDSWLRKYLG
ncbi:hypothetical protein [Gynurincola endophyticus]|jgi:hypothetical protein|uniref:hypothetical protein n=1 Tax=Gynurincola endophyticus TaxID=2479004 RepID=UPI000F8CAC78|nr:hypothetical protein [Gynurincola endophyticus]